jgi:hypothetical protein
MYVNLHPTMRARTIQRKLMVNENRSDDMKVSKILPAVALMTLVMGCASPITSFRDSAGSGALEGFTYRLTRSKVTLDVSLRLEGCNPLIVTLLPIKHSAQPVGDPEYVFRIDPAASYNLLKSVSGTEVSLTHDGRLGSTKAKSEDSSVPLFTQLAQAAKLVLGRSLPEVADKSCTGLTEEVGKLVTLRASLRKEKTNLVDSELKFISRTSQFTKDDEAVLKAFGSARSAIESELAKVNDLLTKTVQIDLTPRARDTAKSVVVGIDMDAGWGTSKPENEECTAPKKRRKEVDGKPLLGANGKEIKVSVSSLGELNDSELPNDCLFLEARMNRSEPFEKVGEEIFGASNQYPGLLYRIPSIGAWTLHARDKSAGKFSLRFGSLLGDAASSFEINKLVTNDQGNIRLNEGYARVAQWGRIGALRSDLSPIGTSGIDIEFDEWSVPKKVTWNAQAGGVAGLLGLGNQLEAARKKADAPTDPSVALKSELLVKLLTECVSANSNALPAFCSGLTK